MTSPSERINIADLAVGNRIESTFAVATAEVKPAKNGKPFMRVELADRTGTVSGIMFDAANNADQFAGRICKVVGVVEEFNGTQLKIDTIESVPCDDVSPYLRTSHLTKADLSEALTNYMVRVGGEEGRIVEEVMSSRDVWDRFLTVPAAEKNHHAWEGGLAEHTLSMLQVADRLAEHYNVFYNAGISTSMLFAGIFLHDLGKIYDYQRDGFAWKRTLVGELRGHISTCQLMIHDAANQCEGDVSKRTVLLLEHLVLSHHGKNEWGSPIEPRTLEAHVLHQIDYLDSRMNMLLEARTGLDVGEMSEWIRPLRGRVMG